MKKIFLSVLTVLFLGILLGCKTESNTTTTTPVSSYGPIQTIEFYSINDLHGTAYSSLVTLSKMGRYLRTRNQNNPNVILLSAGDMFQGTAFSNYYYGRPLVEIMNSVGFDAFTIGNHEFDWGIDKIAAYNDGSVENGEADYPILAANILSVVDDTPMPWTDPYTIVEVSGIKVGIIGVIGQVYNSISASRVEDFYFADEVQTVREYAFELRTVQNCDIVVVSLHGDDSSTNNALANLSGEYRIDALFNGHTHSNEFGTMERAGADLPYAQVNGGSDSLIAKITLTYNNDTNLITQFSAQILGSADMGQTDSEIDSLIEE
jgi:2',3'-cyclic-nucleotide 2'-phosphodiesterase (5'-nucleotidase family)